VKLNLPDGMLPDSIAPLFRLNDTITRMKEEHGLLQVLLQDIYALTCTVRIEEDEYRLHRELKLLKNKVLDFKKQLDEHSKWEEAELFPMASLYFGSEIDVCGIMEQEHDVADQYVDAFIRTLDGAIAPVKHDDARRMASYLFQAYVVLTNHFRDEEELLDSLKECSPAYPN